MLMIVLRLLSPCLNALKSALPKPRRWHLLLIPIAPLLLMVSINAGLVALVWNPFGLHRLLRAKPLSLKGCMIAGAILLCIGV